MSQDSLFSSGQELANLVVSSDLLHDSWATIYELLSHAYLNNPTNLAPIAFKVYYPYNTNGAIIAFVSSPTCTTVHHLQKEMVSSEDLKGSQLDFDFISTKLNPHFSVHKGAIALFASLLNQLSALKLQLDSFSPLIITGHSLGGSVASLFTLWLLDNISLKDNNKRPTCITFGSPFLGDRGLQQAISERPSWNSSFLHVASNQDPIPRFFISPTNGFSGSIPQSCVYKPFGTFLLCSDSDCSCFEEPESVLELMMAMNSISQQQDNGFLVFNYGPILECLKHRVICKGTSQLSDFGVSQLQAGIILQLEAIGIGGQQQTSNMSFLRSMEERVKASFVKKTNAFDPGKKLSKIKEDMAYLEWYKKATLNEGGYYICFKERGSGSRDVVKSREEIVKRHRILTKYWKRMVAEVEKLPQKEEAAFRTRWLYGGTNYRRMVEPLEIAEYYMKGNRDYVNFGRSEHYKLLEKWMNKDKIGGIANDRRKAVSLTEDSCFWAYVEEAIITSKGLREGSSEEKEKSRRNLVNFGEYVMSLIRSYSVSTEIFQPQSTFMKKWWQEYRQDILSSLYSCPLTFYMENEEYRSYA
ncbi:senescence-associated carboxylesterase 101-like isoform X1 [Nicotiana tabacum]|uniref:Senescence-associated carboxylesterase 101-like isoform X1 n=1 Tax=Nicotiana tabacum TaxID=4097 RepID=A0A1S4DBL6_TOBAC|nr:PREDICTED: senescence-associated carboxylesterase 101-like isoform X1 [Nicotiana tabacum]XP_016510828.1 PREDICTED: senescence-associated carboxylesterase 101-like isoform X1 [Nicotiana tabacum]